LQRDLDLISNGRTEIVLKTESGPWFCCTPEAFGALTNFLQDFFETSQFFRARIGKYFSNFGTVFAKNRRDQFFAFWCE